MMLPGVFADLERFAGDWSLVTEAERYTKRLASSMAEMREFYDVITPRAEAAMAYCDTFALDGMAEPALNLLYLLYSMVMVSFPVEVWGQPRVPDSGAATLECVVEPRP